MNISLKQKMITIIVRSLISRMCELAVSLVLRGSFYTSPLIPGNKVSIDISRLVQHLQVSNFQFPLADLISSGLNLGV